MKYSIVSKFIAILLAALLLVSAAVSAFGVAILIGLNQYSMSFEAWRKQATQQKVEELAQAVCQRYAVKKLSDLPEQYMYDTWLFFGTDAELSYDLGLKEDAWCYQISDSTGILLDSSQQWDATGQIYEKTLSVSYPVVAEEGELIFYDEYGTVQTAEYITSAPYTVTVSMAQDALREYNGLTIGFLERFFGMRYGLIVALVSSLVLFAGCAVYLCCAAGKTQKNAQPNPSALNRLPLDLYFGAAGGACTLLGALAVLLLEDWFYTNGIYNLGVVALVAVVLLVAAVIVVGFFFAMAAQLKTPGFFWWHHSIIGWCVDKLWKGVRFVFRGIVALIHMLPVLWRWLLVATGMGLTLLMSILLAVNSGAGVLILLFVLTHCVGVVLYGAYAYGTLLTGAKRMAEGTLDSKIPTRFLMGSYKDCAQHLNALADVATVAARKQMQSERMKTELITNVSHDIKTPLTSIINYVDLLEKAESPEQSAQYLEVLGRQSQRLKKLIDDLMEMSKATTGNMAVDITTVDAAEAVNQALGEFADKLEAADLQTVYSHPDGPVAIRADGRLTWRVLSNLLSNTVKYAQPGTRMYVDMQQTDSAVRISLKNISREPLNISAEELTERFVRGDASRNTEGSGLGLNIAKSLMELQKGQLELLVDGDLFKVTLIFPSGR